jgi:hypothetical protein
MATSGRPCSGVSGLSRADLHCFNVGKTYVKRRPSCDYVVMTSVEFEAEVETR